MRVVVAGGTGFIGTHLCGELASRGHDVAAMAREPEEADLPEGVEPLAADVTAPPSLEGTLDGVDAVVNLVALSPLFTPDGGERMHEVVHHRGTENLLAEAEGAGVDRFVQLSGLGAAPDAPTHFLRAKGRAEEAVRDAALEHVIYRPSIVFGEGGELVGFVKQLKSMFAPGLPIYPLPGGGKTRFQLIWVEDVVPMIADGVTDDERAGETYELGGPEVLTLRGIAQDVFAAEGQSITVVGLPMGLARVGLTALGALGLPLGPDQYRSLELDHTVADNDLDAFGVSEADLRTFRSYLGLDAATDDTAQADARA